MNYRNRRGRILAATMLMVVVAAMTVGRAGPAEAARQFTSAPTPTITGVTRVGMTLTAVPGTWKPQPSKLTYQWYLGSSPVKGATSRLWKVTAAAANRSVRVRVTARRTGFATTTRASTSKRISSGVLTAPTPRLTGAFTVGSTITASPGTWSPTPVALSYQWSVDGAAVAGATRQSWDIPGTAHGRTVKVTVTGRKAGYRSTSRTSTGIVAAQAPAPTLIIPPQLTGDTRVGERLAITPGTWSTPNLEFAFQWLRSGTVIPGATTAGYVATPADLGMTLSVEIRTSKVGYADTVHTMVASSVVEEGVLAAKIPTITGSSADTPRVGSTLTANPGSWSPLPGFAYEWLRDDQSLAIGTTRQYTVTSEDLGHRLSVKVTGTLEGYAPTSATSTPTPAVKLPPGWETTLIPRPGDATGALEIDQISCAQPGSCVAIGQYEFASPLRRGLISTLDDGSWTTQSVPLPPDANPNAHSALHTLSCAKDGFCAAAGFYSDSAGSFRGLIVTRSGPAADWVAREMPVPSGAEGHSGTFEKLSCTAGGMCAALGSYDGNAHQMLTTLEDGLWQAAAVPTLPNPAVEHLLYDVACGSAGSCAAVGSYRIDDRSYGQPFVAQLQAGEWIPASIGSGPGPYPAALTAVTCAGATSCVAVGSYNELGTIRSLIATLENGSWTLTEAPSHYEPLGDSWRPAALQHISCPSPGSCTAVGYERRTRAYSVTLSNGKWTTAAIPIGAQPGIYQLSCGAPGFCTGVGVRSESDLGRRSVILVQADGQWTVGDFQPVSNSPYFSGSLTSISCPTADSCAAAGNYWDTSGGTVHGLIHAWRN